MAQADPDLELADEIGRFYWDPLGFAEFAFAWGSGELKGRQLEDWQREYLDTYGKEIRARGFNGVDAVEAIQMSTRSGHGIGKSCLTAIIILFIMSTRPHCKGVVTANSANQLESKTWAELAKWCRLCITGHWFTITTGRGSMRIYHNDYPDTWRCDAIANRKENSEAFAGLHAANSTPFYIFDEASAVEDVIWEVAEGGTTDGEPHWHVFGNPTRNTGRFRECWGKFRHRWIGRAVDSRKVTITNKKRLQGWIDDYGLESDFVKVRVLGDFPRASHSQFISSDLVEAARRQEILTDPHAPLVLGVDIARFGDDQTVLKLRKGRDARTWPARKYRGRDTMQVAGEVAAVIEEFHPDAVFIDEGGLGAGVVDRLDELGYDVIGVNFGANPSSAMVGGARVANKRAEMYARLREWFKRGEAAIEDDDELQADIVGIQYGIKDSTGAIQLERKEDMKKRGLASPDNSDALALTFAEPVAAREHTYPHHRAGLESDWRPFGD